MVRLYPIRKTALGVTRASLRAQHSRYGLLDEFQLAKTNRFSVSSEANADRERLRSARACSTNGEPHCSAEHSHSEPEPALEPALEPAQGERLVVIKRQSAEGNNTDHVASQAQAQQHQLNLIGKRLAIAVAITVAKPVTPSAGRASCVTQRIPSEPIKASTTADNTMTALRPSKPRQIATRRYAWPGKTRDGQNNGSQGQDQLGPRLEDLELSFERMLAGREIDLPLAIRVHGEQVCGFIGWCEACHHRRAALGWR